jgi:hypothetical protein
MFKKLSEDGAEFAMDAAAKSVKSILNLAPLVDLVWDFKMFILLLLATKQSK